jgi:hypothetical protein
MDGAPEGTQPDQGGPRPRWLVVIALVFAVYLAFRLVEGVVWVGGQL